MNNLHPEKSYEDELTAHLIEADWLESDAAHYGRARALHPRFKSEPLCARLPAPSTLLNQ